MALQSSSVPAPAATRSKAAAASANQGSSWRSFTTSRRISLSGSRPTARMLVEIRASLFTRRPVWFQAPRPRAGLDQGDLVPPPLMPYRILHGNIGASRVPQHVGAVETKMILQGADVFHQVVAAVAPWID